MRNSNTIEFLGVWEELHNPDFNRVQFEAIIWLMFFIKGMKYNSMFDVLVEKEYPFKEI